MARGLTHESIRIQSVEWYTPPCIFDALKLEFDLDVCSPGADIVPWIPARRHYTITDDGLDSPWTGRVWCNPPYGKHTSVWLERLAKHGNGIALVLSRTDTEWFHRAASSADMTCFMRGRIRFIANNDGKLSQPGNVGAGSALFAFGLENARALETSGLGLCLRR
jgi:DNA N-6-adenine-methyltransferase (Dam)